GKPGILRRSIRSAEGCLRSSSGQSYDRYVNEPYAILEPRPPLIRGRRRLQVRGDLIYGTPGRGDYRVRLVAAETQGWRKPEDVALRHGPGDHPALEQRRPTDGPTFFAGSKNLRSALSSTNSTAQRRPSPRT